MAISLRYHEGAGPSWQLHDFLHGVEEDNGSEPKALHHGGAQEFWRDMGEIELWSGTANCQWDINMFDIFDVWWKVELFGQE